MDNDSSLNSLRPVRSYTLYKQVEEQLSTLFLNGSLRPGDKLPSERELQKKLGVSRAVLREALRILEAKGLVEGKQGKGRFVRADLEQLTTLEELNGDPMIKLEKVTLGEIYEIRLVLEPSIARWAAERSTSSDIKDLADSLENIDQSDQYNEADFHFHLTLARSSHNQMAVRTIQSYFQTQLLYSLQLFERVRSHYPIDRWQADHEEILEAVKRRDGDRAAQTMRKHIEYSYELIKQT